MKNLVLIPQLKEYRNMAIQSQAQFDFKSYNQVMTGAGVGMKLFLVTQMLADVQASFFRYKNPLLGDITDILDETECLRTALKAANAKREKSTPVIDGTV